MTAWLEKMRQVPDYVSSNGDPLSTITHMARTSRRVDAWERKIDRKTAAARPSLRNPEDAPELWTTSREDRQPCVKPSSRSRRRTRS